MRSFKYRGKRHRSRSQAAVAMMKNTKWSQSAISRILDISPQTVTALKKIHSLRVAVA